MNGVRPEDHVGLVRSVAAHLAQRLPGAEFDELVGDGLEALVRMAPDFDADRGVPFAAWAWSKLRWRMIEAHRTRTGWRKSRRPAAVVPLGDSVASSTGLPARIEAGEYSRWTEGGSSASAEHEAMGEIAYDEAMATLTPKLRRVAEAAMVPGGRSALAREWGVSEAMVSIHMREVRRRLGRYVERAEAA